MKKVTRVLVNGTPGEAQPCFSHLEEGLQCLEWSKELHANTELSVSKMKVEAVKPPCGSNH